MAKVAQIPGPVGTELLEGLAEKLQRSFWGIMIRPQEHFPNKWRMEYMFLQHKSSLVSVFSVSNGLWEVLRNVKSSFIINMCADMHICTKRLKYRLGHLLNYDYKEKEFKLIENLTLFILCKPS